MLRPTQNKQLFSMKLSLNSISREPTAIKQTVIAREIESSNTPKKEMKWAGPTWIFLHTLAEKIDEERFSEVRLGVLDIIYTVCSLLPCPICASHAKTFLDGVNFNTIQTKEDLKNLLFTFHNLVSKNKNLEIYNETILDKYKDAITNKVIQNFMIIFEKKSGNIRLIPDDLQRKRKTIEIKQWFNDNIHYFSS